MPKVTLHFTLCLCRPKTCPPMHRLCKIKCFNNIWNSSNNKIRPSMPYDNLWQLFSWVYPDIIQKFCDVFTTFVNTSQLRIQLSLDTLLSNLQNHDKHIYFWNLVTEYFAQNVKHNNWFNYTNKKWLIYHVWRIH